MNNLINKLTNAFSARMESQGAVIGGFLLVVGTILLLYQLISVLFYSSATETGLFGWSLGLVSVGLGVIAIHLSIKIGKIHAKSLTRLYESFIAYRIEWLTDKFTPPTQEQKKEILERLERLKEERLEIPKEERPEEDSKSAAQRRVDEDKKRVGYVRGEIYEIEDGKWGVNWGGKYPL